MSINIDNFTITKKTKQFIMMTAKKTGTARTTLKVVNKRAGRKTETAPLKWKVATTLLKAMKEDTKMKNVRIMLAAGFFTGLRISDILRLRWKDLLSDSFEIVEQKTGKLRSIKIVPAFRGIINDVYDNETLNTFVCRSGSYNSENNNKAITVMSANKRIKRAFDKYGVDAQNASSHTLRKTFARRIWEFNGKTDEALIYLSELLGHSSTKMTRKYIGITKQRIDNLYDCLF